MHFVIKIQTSSVIVLLLYYCCCICNILSALSYHHITHLQTVWKLPDEIDKYRETSCSEIYLNIC